MRCDNIECTLIFPFLKQSIAWTLQYAITSYGFYAMGAVCHFRLLIQILRQGTYVNSFDLAKMCYSLMCSNNKLTEKLNIKGNNIIIKLTNIRIKSFLKYVYIYCIYPKFVGNAGIRNFIVFCINYSALYTVINYTNIYCGLEAAYLCIDRSSRWYSSFMRAITA